jgi:hypothetical protein
VWGPGENCSKLATTKRDRKKPMTGRRRASRRRRWKTAVAPTQGSLLRRSVLSAET